MAPSPASRDRFRPPSATLMHALLAPARRYFAPRFFGLEALDLSRPALWVGNHTLFGGQDFPLMVEHLYYHHGIYLRGLGDRGHFKVPLWRQWVTHYGAVLGTPENCARLMRAGQHVLVFPGGAREVFGRKGEAHSLRWKQRSGFARLAIEHGYDTIPFGSGGADDNYRILLDAGDYLRTPLWRWLSTHTTIAEATRNGEVLMPIVRGIGPTLLPRPQVYYFGFGARIPSVALAGMDRDPEAVWQLREQVAAAVTQQIESLLQRRAADRLERWPRWRRWLTADA